jgi:chaperone modulatory protein CbpM
MAKQIFTHQSIEACESLDLHALSSLCNISPEEVRELVDYGAIKPMNSTTLEIQFSVDYIKPLQSACQIRQDYDFDLFSVVIFLGFLNRIEELETKVQHLLATAHNEFPK